MDIEEFKAKYHKGIHYEILLEKWSSLTSQLNDLDYEVRMDAQYWTFYQLAKKVKEYETMKAKYVYLTGLLDEIVTEAKNRNFATFIPPSELKDYIQD